MDLFDFLSKGDVEYFTGVELDVLQNCRDENDDTLLSKAVILNQFECCRVIYERCPSLLWHQNSFSNTALHHAVYNGAPMSFIDFLIARATTNEADLEKGKKWLHIQNSEGDTSLHCAVIMRSVEITQMLMNVDSENELLKIPNFKKNTPLHIAVEFQHIQLVKTLAIPDPDFEYRLNSEDETPLLIAMRKSVSGDVTAAEIKKLLLVKQPNQCKAKTGERGWTVLHHAASKGDKAMIEDIFQFCPECIHILDNYGSNFLHIAAEYDQENLVAHILKSKNIHPAILNGQDSSGNTPLHVAAAVGNLLMMLYFLYHPNVNKVMKNPRGLTPVDLISFDYDKGRGKKQEKKDNGNARDQQAWDALYQIALDRLKSGNVLYFNGVEIDVLQNSRYENDNTLLSKAATLNHLECCREIYRRCPSLLWHQNSHKQTALHLASSGASLGIVEFFIDCALKPTNEADLAKGKKWLVAQDIEGETCLHYSVRTSSVEIMQKLMDVDPHHELLKIANKTGNTPLHMAVRYKLFNVVTILAIPEFDFEYTSNEDGETPLLIAIRNAIDNDETAVRIRKFLLEKQPNQCKTKTKKGWTALHHAAFRGDINTAEEICQFSPDCMKIVDDDGRNFLHLAAEYKHVNFARRILDREDISLDIINGKDNEGNTPLHVAAQGENRPIVLCFLYNSKVEKNTMNAKGQNVLDSITFEYDPQKAGVNETLMILSHEGDLKEQSNFDLVVGALIATVSFAAGVNIPGGYISGGKNNGTAVLSKEISFKIFVIANNFALLLSLYTVSSHFCVRRILKKDDIIYHPQSATFRTRLLIKRDDLLHQLNAATLCTLGAIYAMVVAFLTGSYAVLAESKELVITIFISSGCFLGFACRAVWRMVKKSRGTPNFD